MHSSQNSTNFALAKTKMVAWMSGLVTGLQNRAQRFESASDLIKKHLISEVLFCVFFLSITLVIIFVCKKNGKIVFIWITFINFVTK